MLFRHCPAKDGTTARGPGSRLAWHQEILLGDKDERVLNRGCVSSRRLLYWRTVSAFVCVHTRIKHMLRV